MSTKLKMKTDYTLQEKIDYLKLKEIPKTITQIKDLNFKVLRGYDEKKYKQYRFINIDDIDILLTPTNRLNTLQERYGKAKPLHSYLERKGKDSEEDNVTFINMLKKVSIAEIEKVEEEQEKLLKNIPFRVKFEGNYLWQIYYSEATSRYFMLVPTEESDYSTFFYLLKKKIEGKKGTKVFVPVSYVDYETDLIKKSEIRDIENYLWQFTKDYPSIYEVHDKKGEQTIQIVGDTEIYGKIKTLYKMSFDNSKDLSKFYKLLKVLFILQTELPHYFDFSTNIETDGKLEFYLKNSKIHYENLPEFVLEQYMRSVTMKQSTEEEIQRLIEKLEELKLDAKILESDYISKEKQISTYLECKKTFFGKVKYFFKIGKKSNKKEHKNKDKEEELEEDKKEFSKARVKVKVENRNYTLDEVIGSYKEVEILDNKRRDLAMDINALKLKNKNLKKKIENATLYINEINKHKKSIFEFWKYSNKDAVASLEEGEAEEINVSRIEKQFNYEEDFEKFGEEADKNQRRTFTDLELDSSFIATTDLLEYINKIYKKDIESKELSSKVKELKEKMDIPDDEFDVFGKMGSDKTQERNLGSKIHRENPRDIYSILGIQKGYKGVDLKVSLENMLKDLKSALKKNKTQEDIYIYKATPYEISLDEIQTFSLNEEQELKECLSMEKVGRKVMLYRVKLDKGSHFIACSNIVYYDNKNMTLPVGMSNSNKIIVDLSELNLKETDTKELNKAYLDSNNDSSKIILKTIDVVELESK